MGGEDGPRLSNDIPGTTILVANGISNLETNVRLFQLVQLDISATYVNVEHHAIASVSINSSRDNDELILGNKVADASLPLGGLWLRSNVELEGVCDADDKQKAAEVLQQRALRRHGCVELSTVKGNGWYRGGRRKFYKLASSYFCDKGASN